MKAGAGFGIDKAALSNDSNMLSLQKQLMKLDMNNDLANALAPKDKEVPKDDGAAIKLAKEQAGALKREQEHKKMVEAALEKLRLEREHRMNDRGRPAGGGGRRVPG